GAAGVERCAAGRIGERAAAGRAGGGPADRGTHRQEPVLDFGDRRWSEEDRSSASGRRAADHRCTTRDGAHGRRRRRDRADAERRRREAVRQGGRNRHASTQSHQLQGLPANTVIGPTPLLDAFKRGEVERDVRLLAAQGALAPRAYEQLAILVLLLEDRDAEIRQTADDTLNRIPEQALKAFLARSDVPIGLREFFADRGIFPDEIPQI